MNKKSKSLWNLFFKAGEFQSAEQVKNKAICEGNKKRGNKCDRTSRHWEKHFLQGDIDFAIATDDLRKEDFEEESYEMTANSWVILEK